jgi:hypothetical protein
MKRGSLSLGMAGLGLFDQKSTIAETMPIAPPSNSVLDKEKTGS